MKQIIFAIGLVAASFSLKAQQEISYEVSFPNAVHHEAQISLSIPNVAKGPLKVRMSRSSPGRYATHEFAKNVYNFKAFDANGKALNITRPETDVFEITNPGNSVKVTYTLFGNWIDGTYAGFDETHAHMNIPGTFAYPVGMDERPRTVKFNYADKQGWKIATQLKPMPKDVYYAPNLQYFMDSPIEISAYKTASWQVKNTDGKNQTIHLISHSNDGQKVVDNFANMIKRVVTEQMAVWGELPNFDYGNYHFLHDAHNEYAGDGMEHRNSTVIVQVTPKIEGFERRWLSTFSHEFFHAWNVERLRPKTLEPFKFEHSNISDGLWLAEGFTQYYGTNLLMARAGFRTQEELLSNLGNIVDAVLNLPGAKNFSPIQASQYGVFADAGVAIDQTNQSNIFVSYYTYGAAVALALDLRLRAEFKLTLDDYMRALWKAHGKPEIAYTIPDLEKVLAQLTKNPAFAADFFKNYIYGTAKNDYAKLLLNAGFVLRKAKPGKAYSGMRLKFENGKGILSQTLQGTPAYNAGLDVDNVILNIDGTEIKDQETFTKTIDAHKPGDVITITYTYHGQEKTTKLTLAENPFLEIVAIEKTGAALSPEMLAFRNSWLNSQVK
jgi:predicted metalloprotease with PDZ domain